MRNAALGADAEMLRVEFHILDVQIDEFLQPDAGTQEEFDDEPAACSAIVLACLCVSARRQETAIHLAVLSGSTSRTSRKGN